MSAAQSDQATMAAISNKLTWLLASVLTVYAAYLCAQVTWFVLDDGNVGPLNLPAQTQQVKSKTNSKASALSSYQLFGKAGAKKVEKRETKTAPKTTLRLMLKGVFTGDQGGGSGAIIEEIGRSTEYYRIGQTVPGNATLEEVYSDRVLLRRNGRLETLSFDEKAPAGTSIAKVDRPSVRRRGGNAQVTSPEQFLDVATKRLEEDPENALKSVGLASNEGGGYVYQGRNPMLAGLNLQKGDVIMSVNGHTLGDVQKDKALMKSLYEQGSLEVEVVRDGASFYVNYPLR